MVAAHLTSMSKKPTFPSRVPPGTPAGGQFAATQHPEATVDLIERGSATDPAAEYADAWGQVERDYVLLIEGIDRLNPDVRAERFESVATHFEHQAHLAAQDYEAHELPKPGDTVLSAKFGRLAGAASCASRARIASRGGTQQLDAEQAGADAIVGKALDTRDVVASNGVPFRARLVRRGQQWGMSGALTAEEDMVFFFDARCPHFPPMIGSEHENRDQTERNGQHISHYFASTLRAHPHGAGLNLDAGIPDWRIDAKTFSEVSGWLDRRAPLSSNEFAGSEIIQGEVLDERGIDR